MSITYTTSDLETDPLRILDEVREGKTVNLACDGEIFAEIRPVEGRKQTNEERYEELKRRGAIVPSGYPRRPLKPTHNVPGALARFLAERHGCRCECGQYQCECK